MRLQGLCYAVVVDGIYIFDRHPHALVTGFIAVRPECHLDVALATSTLSVFAQEDLTFTRADSAEAGRIAPVPPLFPAELYEPRKALSNIGHVKDRDQTVGEHSEILARQEH